MRRFALLVVITVLAAPGLVRADDLEKIPQKKRGLYEELDREIQKMKSHETDEEPCPVALQPTTRAYPFLEHHGMFRFRTHGYFRMHLGTQDADRGVTTSAFEPPLTENRINNDPSGEFASSGVGSSRSEDWLGDANIRLRYTPSLHITKDLAIHAQLDLLDNLVLGSTPDYGGYLGRADVPLVLYSDGQVPPTPGVNSWQQSLQVRQAYGEWVLPLAVVRLGRQADHWGLGMVANGGQEPDSDYGDFVDRAALLMPFNGFKLMLAYDWVWEGVTSAGSADLAGPVHDLDDADDVRQVVVQLFDRPITDEERSYRQNRLHVLRKPVFDWGAYVSWRSQRLDVHGDDYVAWLDGAKETSAIRLVPREAWSVTPDLWMRFLYNPTIDWALRVELEAAMVIGSIENVLMHDQTDASADLMQYGGVIQTEARYKQLSFGVEGGLASGDETGGFATYGAHALYSEGEGGAVDVNRELTGFGFDRDYRPDLVLYRYVIGGVTNSFYVKPWVSYDFLAGDEGSLGLSLATLYSRALETAGTPGGSANLGTEIDLSVFFGQSERFLATLDWGVLVPLAGLDRAAPTHKEASWATILRARVIWTF